MADRQDIDALLIGALYGELDDDERGRLDAHLASHPQDRTALDGLRSTRQLLVDADLPALAGAEPSGAISARLLQEAARRAPAPRSERRGILAFLATLVRPVMAHPALASVAALVLVAGVAGLVYRSGGFDTEAPTAPGASSTHDERLALETSPDTTVVGGVPAATPSGAADNGETQYQVQMAEPLTLAMGDDLAKENEAKDGLDEATRGRVNREGRADQAKKGAKPAARRTENQTGYIALDKNAASTPTVRDADGKLVDSRDDDEVAAPPPAPPARAGVAQGAARGAPSPATGAYDAKLDAATIAWARDQHAWMVKLVNAGKCNDAGAVGAEIARRAPEYYQANVSNDRAIRSCRAYVERARRSRQSEQSKSKAAAPRSADQPDMMDPYESAK